MIDSIDHIKNTGNETQISLIKERWYFGRGMFVAVNSLITGSGAYALPFGCEEIIIMSYASEIYRI
jgi:hypothetical protein